jgi:hypothetical protein
LFIQIISHCSISKIIDVTGSLATDSPAEPSVPAQTKTVSDFKTNDSVL